jgi:hypothetical protein
VPEGLIEFIPELDALFQDMNVIAIDVKEDIEA